MKHLILSLFLFIPITLFAFGRKKASIKNGNSYAYVLMGSSQRVFPGMQKTPPHTDYKFIIVWQSNTTPKAFFWNSGSGVYNCNVSKAGNKKISDKDNTYTIKKGDTLMLSAAQTATLPASLKTNNNSILINVQKNIWVYLRVKKIVNKPDVYMP